MPKRSELTPQTKFVLAAAAITLSSFWIRAADLYRLPVFSDEGNHIQWAQRFSVGNSTYPILMDTKFLFGIVLSMFRVMGPSPLWLSRMATALFSILSCAACMIGGRLLHSKKAGVLSGALYAALPYTVFFDRQALADPLVADVGALVIVFTLLLALKKREHIVESIALTLSLAAVGLVKLSGFLFYFFPAAVITLFPNSFQPWRRLAGKMLVPVFTSFLVASAFLAALAPRWGYNDNKLISQQVGFLVCPPILCQGNANAQIDNIDRALGSLIDLIPPYFGWPIVALALLALPLSPPPKKRGVALISIVVLTMTTAFLVSGRDIPPRYFSFLPVPIVTLAAGALISIVERVAASFGTAPAASAFAALLAIIAPSLANTLPLLVAPERAALPNLDKQGYFTNTYGGTGIREAALNAQRAEASSSQPPVIIVIGSIHLNSVAAYFDPTRIDVRSSGSVGAVDIGRWLFRGQHIYTLDELSEEGVTLESEESDLFSSDGLRYLELGRYPRMQGQRTIRLRMVSGVSAELRHQIFREAFIKPEKVADHYRAFANDFVSSGEKVTVIAYPPTQTTMLDDELGSRPNVQVVGIGDSWPLDVASARAQLSELAQRNTMLEAVFLEETNGDPSRSIESWLNSHLFRLDEQWYGPLRVIKFASDGSVTQKLPAGARFGDAIVLESVQIVDSTAKPGGYIRMRLIWQATAPITQQLKVFTHLFAGSKIIAQHDGQPVGELRPTNTWPAGEYIVDQFAVGIPADAPPGAYQLRIGMYDIVTQARLPMIQSDGIGSEFYVGGDIEIR